MPPNLVDISNFNGLRNFQHFFPEFILLKSNSLFQCTSSGKGSMLKWVFIVEGFNYELNTRYNSSVWRISRFSNMRGQTNADVCSCKPLAIVNHYDPCRSKYLFVFGRAFEEICLGVDCCAFQTGNYCLNFSQLNRCKLATIQVLIQLHVPCPYLSYTSYWSYQ